MKGGQPLRLPGLESQPLALPHLQQTAVSLQVSVIGGQQQQAGPPGDGVAPPRQFPPPFIPEAEPPRLNRQARPLERWNTWPMRMPNAARLAPSWGDDRIEQQDGMAAASQEPGAGKADDARTHHDDLRGGGAPGAMQRPGGWDGVVRPA